MGTSEREPFLSTGSRTEIEFYHVARFVDFRMRHMQLLTSASNFKMGQLTSWLACLSPWKRMLWKMFAIA